METYCPTTEITEANESEAWLVPSLIGAAVGAVLALAIFSRAQALAVALPFLCAAAAFDLRTMRLPDRLTLPAIGVACLGAALWGQPSDALFGLAFSMLLGMAIHLMRPDGMGLGDVKLLAAIGVALGIQGAITTIGVGSVLSISAIVVHRLRARNIVHIPAGPYLIAGSIVAVIIFHNFYPHSP